uniref:Tudor domain-containing protein 10 isoform X2 n=1 Tax=Geotrypetes seraphini TaxID=260995 RepID=A0A6P8QQ55_GEOSA|nr:tudor domain-containing protein 10 isoform X2 [Geotrypetes seraphini]
MNWLAMDGGGRCRSRGSVSGAAGRCVARADRNTLRLMDFPMARRGPNGRGGDELNEDFLKTQQAVGVTKTEQRRAQQELYAGNLPSNISMKHLKSLFSKYNPKCIRKVETERKCYAFIDFEDSETLELAIKQLNNTTYEGRRLIVHMAHQKRKERVSWKNTKRESEDISKETKEPSDTLTSDMYAELDKSSLCANSEYLCYEEDEQDVCETPDQGGHMIQDQDMYVTSKQHSCIIHDQGVCMMTVLHQQSRNLDLEEKKLLLEIKKLEMEIRKLKT